jgi:hypothetical protein
LGWRCQLAFKTPTRCADTPGSVSSNRAKQPIETNADSQNNAQSDGIHLANANAASWGQEANNCFDADITQGFDVRIKKLQ